MSSPHRRSVSRGRSRTPARPAAATSDNARRSNSRSNSRDHANGTRDSRSRSRGRSHSRSRSRGRSRSISRSRSRSGSGSRGDQPRSAKIVIEKLTKNVNATHLREIFSTYGAIQELEMPMNKHFMTNRGIAYVLYSQASYAEAAIANMHEAQLDGALISVSIVLPRRRFSRSPPPMRPPPNRFGEPHRHRDGPPPLPSMRGRGGRWGGSPAPPSRYGPPPRGGGGGGGYRDRYDDRDSYRPRSYSRSRSPPMRRRSPSYSGRSRSPSRSPPVRGRGPPRGGGGGGRRRRSYSYSSYSSRSRSRSRDRGGRGRR